MNRLKWVKPIGPFHPHFRLRLNRMNEATKILTDVTLGNRTKVDRLSELVYTELHNRAQFFLRKENAGNVLQPTALVHEAFMRLVDQKRVTWEGRSHFLAIGAQMMRRILVDEAKHRRRLKRGGDRQRIELQEELTVTPGKSEDIEAVHDALEKLEELNPLHARIVEMRFFAGMTVAEVAIALDKPQRSVERLWKSIRAWLRRELSEGDDS